MPAGCWDLSEFSGGMVLSEIEINSVVIKSCIEMNWTAIIDISHGSNVSTDVCWFCYEIPKLLLYTVLLYWEKDSPNMYYSSDSSENSWTVWTVKRVQAHIQIIHSLWTPKFSIEFYSLLL